MTMYPVVLATCWLLLLVFKGGSGAWKNDRHCGESRYPDAGELTSPLGRIVGGEDAREHEFPYQAAILWSGLNIIVCGGVLITKYWIATAAHCILTDDTVRFNRDFDIRLGEHDVTEISPKERKIEAARIIVHEQFQYPVARTNDIALIKLAEKARNKKGRIRPICRPTPGNTYADETVVASGWGRLYANGTGAGPRSYTLQYAPLVVTPQTDCEDAYGASNLTSTMVCASDGANTTVRDACFGDSGGPLAWKKQGRFYLVGLTSWGPQGLCAAGTPGVYARVSELLTWIDSKI